MHHMAKFVTIFSYHINSTFLSIKVKQQIK